MLSEAIRPEGEDKLTLLKARVENKRGQVLQAEQELENAQGDKRIVWENRLNQRKEELEEAEEELKAFEEDLSQAA